MWQIFNYKQKGTNDETEERSLGLKSKNEYVSAQFKNKADVILFSFLSRQLQEGVF